MTRGNSNPKRRRIRTAIRKTALKTGKWCGAVITVLMLVVWIGSGWWYANARGFRHSTAMEVTAIRGMIWLKWITFSRGGDEQFLKCYLVHWSQYGGGQQPSVRTGWILRSSWHWRRDRGVFGDSLDFVCPLWAPLVIVLAGTSLVWGADLRATRRAKVGLCAACGYDLVGLAGTAAGAMCPECGKVRSA